MDVLSEIGRWKPWVAFASLSVLLLLEWWVPFRISLQPKLRHVVTNCVIAGGNAAIVNVLFGGVLLTWSHRADREGWGLLHYVGLGPIADIVAAVVVLDLVFYGVHWANHQVPWDRMLGTYTMRTPRNEIRIGLDEYPLPKDVGLFSFYLMPFGRARRSGRDGL